jgi:hypothetical protein
LPPNANESSAINKSFCLKFAFFARDSPETLRRFVEQMVIYGVDTMGGKLKRE